LKKAPSISSDENNSEFAIFKVEKVKKTVIGRSRVNSENNVFTLPIDNSVLHTNSIKNGKKCNRKYSMNIEFESKKIDLMTSPIKEPIKEQIFEDEEEEKEFKGNMIETNFIRHNTTGAKEINKFEENQLFFGVLVSKRIEEKKMESDQAATKKQIEQLEQQVEKLRDEETKLVEEIKFLSTIREKMARTASQAMAQARETKEELKVKELLILDLNKKFQETEFRLNSFVALYEEVRNARNKYVSLIQNSSQDLAEMKERIKILQNEVEILRNECSDKDRDLVDIKHNVTISVYKRDSQRAELNK